MTKQAPYWIQYTSYMGIPYGANMGFATGINLGFIWLAYGSSNIYLPEKTSYQKVKVPVLLMDRLVRSQQRETDMYN